MTPAEPTIPAGMKAWAGGDSAPADIGECCDVMHANGTIGLANKRSILWGRPSAKPLDTDRIGDPCGVPIEQLWIIAYTPRTPEPTGDTREQVAREVLARHMTAKADTSPTANEWAFILRHVPKLSEHGAVRAAVNAMLEFSSTSGSLKLDRASLTALLAKTDAECDPAWDYGPQADAILAALPPARDVEVRDV